MAKEIKHYKSKYGDEQTNKQTDEIGEYKHTAFGSNEGSGNCDL